jgi:hypothetical protein
MYERIYRRDVLWAAWEKVRANGGEAGVDGVSIEAVEMREIFMPGSTRGEWVVLEFSASPTLPAPGSAQT